MKHIIFTLFVVWGVTACAPGRRVDALPQSKIEASSDMLVSYDKFTGIHQCSKVLSRGGGVVAGFMALRQTKTPTVDPQMLLFLRYVGNDWLFIDRLYLIDGKERRAISTSSDVANGGTVHETVAFDLPYEDFIKLGDPFEASIRGSKGSREILFSKAEYEAVRECSLGALF